MKKISIIFLFFILALFIFILPEVNANGTIDFMGACETFDQQTVISSGHTKILVTDGINQIDKTIKHENENGSDDTNDYNIVQTTIDFGRVSKDSLLEFFFYTVDENIEYGTQFLTVTDTVNNTTICKIDKEGGNNKNNVRIVGNNVGVIINPSYFELDWTDHSNLTNALENRGFTYTFKEEVGGNGDVGSIRNYNLLETNKGWYL